MINSNDIKEILPYDYPFLLVDKVLEIDKESITAVKNVSINEKFFKGHFKDFPIMPGALIIEGIAQAATILVRQSMENHNENDLLAYQLKNASFTIPVLAGDKIHYQAKICTNLIFKTITKNKLFKIKGKALVNDKEVAKANFIIARVNRERFRKKFSKGFEC